MLEICRPRELGKRYQLGSSNHSHSRNSNLLDLCLLRSKRADGIVQSVKSCRDFGHGETLTSPRDIQPPRTTWTFALVGTV